MTDISSGRLVAPHVSEALVSGGNAAGAYPWTSLKKAVNPYLDPAEVAPVSALSNLITLYIADNQQEQLRREALSDEVWERYFFNESRDPVQSEMEQDQLISRARMAHEQQRFNPDLVILANVSAEPAHVSKPLLGRIKFFQGLGRPKAYSRYLRETIMPCLERLECVRESQVSASFRFMASHEGLEGLLVLPEMNQEQVKRLSTLVAAHMSLCLDAACSDLFVTDDVKPEQIRQSWEKVAAEAMRLDVIPPAFEQLRRKKRRRKPVPYDLIPGSLARMLCADWWYRKLWQMRCEWREEQLRAVCLVNRKASPYVSYEAVIHKREQRRKSLEFFQSHELVNADGDTLDMEDVVNASSSNPAHRRNEMMACVKGLELIAEMRGDCAVFYTITCPSRFHATPTTAGPTRSGPAKRSGRAVIIWSIRSPHSAKPCTKPGCAGMACALLSHITTAPCTGICCALCAKKTAAPLLHCCVNSPFVKTAQSWATILAHASSLNSSTRAKARRPATSPNTSARTSTGVDWQKRSAKKPVNHYATAPSTSVPGHRFTAFSNSVSSVFQDARHTASCVCLPGRPRERRATKKPVCRCWKIHGSMPC